MITVFLEFSLLSSTVVYCLTVDTVILETAVPSLDIYVLGKVL